MIHSGKDIRMRIKMQKTNFLSFGQMSLAKRLHDPASDRMIATNRNWSHPCRVYFLILISYLLDTMLIVVGPGERNITRIYDRRQFPRVNLKPGMGPPLQS